MKKNVCLALLISIISVLACSKDEMLSTVTTTETSSATKAYISPRLAEVMNMLDTCTVPLPIEQLCPIMNGSSEILYNENEPLTRGVVLDTLLGYSNSEVLYIDQPVTFTDVQIENWGDAVPGNITAGITYYLKLVAVTYDLLDSRTIIKPSYMGTKIGVDPDNENRLGYHLESLASGLYRFTSYVYSLKREKESYYSIYIPRHIFYDEYNLSWFYYAVD